MSRNLDGNKKDDLTKYALVFAGGFIAGFAIKNALESKTFENVKNNALDMVNDYFNHQIEYEDLDDEVIDVKNVIKDE